MRLVNKRAGPRHRKAAGSPSRRNTAPDRDRERLALAAARRIEALADAASLRARTRSYPGSTYCAFESSGITSARLPGFGEHQSLLPSADACPDRGSARPSGRNDGQSRRDLAARRIGLRHGQRPARLCRRHARSRRRRPPRTGSVRRVPTCRSCRCPRRTSHTSPPGRSGIYRFSLLAAKNPSERPSGDQNTDVGAFGAGERPGSSRRHGRIQMRERRPRSDGDERELRAVRRQRERHRVSTVSTNAPPAGGGRANLIGTRRSPDAAGRSQRHAPARRRPPRRRPPWHQATTRARRRFQRRRRLRLRSRRLRSTSSWSFTSRARLPALIGLLRKTRRTRCSSGGVAARSDTSAAAVLQNRRRQRDAARSFERASCPSPFRRAPRRRRRCRCARRASAPRAARAPCTAACPRIVPSSVRCVRRRHGVDRASPADRRAAVELGQAEVEQLHPDFVSMMFAGLQVAVDDALAMRVVERVGNLDRDSAASASSGSGPFASRSASVSPSSSSITRNSTSTPVVADVVERADVGMRELRRSSRASRSKRWRAPATTAMSGGEP